LVPVLADRGPADAQYEGPARFAGLARNVDADRVGVLLNALGREHGRRPPIASSQFARR